MINEKKITDVQDSNQNPSVCKTNSLPTEMSNEEELDWFS